jgi:ubiquinone/menaquinone biosynthesis C-methylase UbiE
MRLWEVYARVYDSLPKHFRPYQRLLVDVGQIVEDGCPAGSRILDVGCGTGNFCLELGERGYDVTGVDCSAAMLQRAGGKRLRRNLSRVEFIKADLDNGLDYADSSFDGLICIHSLYTLRDPQRSLQEYYRVLKPWSRLVVCEPQRPINVFACLREAWRDGGVANLGMVLASQFGVGILNLIIGSRQSDGTYHYWDDTGLRSLLHDAGFRVDNTRETYTTKVDVLAVARKPRYERRSESGAYRIISVDTEEDLERACGFRYRAYSERDMIAANEIQLEKDDFDAIARHYIALDGNEVVGCVRIIPDNPSGFPMESDFPLTEYRKQRHIREGEAAEITRLIIAGDKAEAIPALYLTVFDDARANGINHLFGSAGHFLAPKYEGIGFRVIGPAFNYSKISGTYLPLHLDIWHEVDGFRKEPSGYNQELGGMLVRDVDEAE